MLIAQLCLASNERGGDWFYRVHGPGRALAASDGVWAIDAPHIHRHRAQLIDQADVLVINMVPDVDLRPAIAARRRRGQVTVFELNDDVAHLHPDNPYARFYADPYEVTKLKQLLAACDAVQFSTAELHRIYARYARRSAVFMNQMPPRRHPPHPRGAKLVVGWGGSIGHLSDLAWAAPALCRWINQRPDVELRIMADRRLFDLFQLLPADKKRHVPVGDIDAYYDFVAGIDIGIAPLQDTGFNRCRSDVKFLEFALHGAVPVVQDLAPYRATVRDSETGVLFGDPDSLIAALDHLAASSETRAAIADSAAAYVERERTQTVAGAQRLAFYRELLPVVQDDARTAHAQQVVEALTGGAGGAGGAGNVRDGRHLQLGFGDYEQLIHRALELGHVARPAEALGLLHQAAAQEPLAYQPWVFSALFATRDRRTQYLRQALACNPGSLSSWIDLGDLLDADGDPDGALRAYTSAAELDPTFDLPYAKTSLLLSKLGRPIEARQFGAIAHQIQQPFVS